MVQDIRETVRAFVMAHQQRDVACGDHDRETCLCGEPDASLREAARDERSRAQHRFSWQEHFEEAWDVEIAPLLATREGSR